MEISSPILLPREVTPDDSASMTEQLMGRFVTLRDQAAFAELLRLYGPMVFGVCRRILGNHHDAEDVFQSTFLLLARNAGSIQHPAGIAVWLHRVAYHAALRVKSANQARQLKELRMNEIPEPAVAERKLWPEIDPLLDQELNRLPIKYRLPVLLCDVAGKTIKEAAAEMGCPMGTISSRLARARKLLARRLTRQGVMLSSATLVVLLAQNAASAAVPVALMTSTLASATAISTAQSTAAGTIFTKVLALFKSVVPSALFGNAAAVAVASTVIIGAGVLLQPGPNQAAKKVAHVKLAAPFEEIANTYRKNYAAIKTLRMEYTERDEHLIGSEIIWNAWGLFPVTAVDNLTTLIIDHEKVHVKFWEKTKDHNTIIDLVKKKNPDRYPNPSANIGQRVSYQEFDEQIPNAAWEFHERINIYDGRRIRNNNHDMKLGIGDKVLRPAYNSWTPTNDSAFQQPNFLDLMLCGIVGSELPGANKWREQFRLPDLLAAGKWHVVAEHQSVDGDDCLVIESAETDKLWLDRKSGFALRRWTKDRPYKSEIVCRGYQQRSEDLWIPSHIDHTTYGDQKMPAEYRGKPCQIKHLELKQIELNQPVSEDSFQLSAPEGALVFDVDLKPLDASGNPIDSGGRIVYYVQPADPADIPNVALQAQIDLGTKIVKYANGAQAPTRAPTAVPAPVVSSGLAKHGFVVANVLLLLIGIGYLIYRRRSA